jgi:hypothetical protein
MVVSREVLLKSFRLMILPAVRMCVRHSVSIQEAIEILKSAFVQAAHEDFKRTGQEANISRVSAAIGLHRRDVTRLTNDSGTKTDPLNFVVRVTGHWQSDARFSNRGRARLLTCDGPDSQFSKLIQSISKDLKPVTILFELERIGLVKRRGNRVKLMRRAFVPTGDAEALIQLLARDAAQLIAAVEENAFGKLEIPNVHARTHYDRVVKDAVPAIREWLLREGSALHQRARNYLSQFDVDINPQLGTTKEVVKVSLGTFSLVEPHDKK